MKGEDKGPRIVAFASGKGGVGKTVLTANVGIYLATLGKRVVVVDAALGCSTLHLFLGANPRRTLAESLSGHVTHLGELVEATGIPGLSIIGGAHDPAWVADPRPDQVRGMLAQLSELDVDHVLVDLGAGIGGIALDTFLSAKRRVLALTPEPTSVAMAYRFIRAVFFRRLRKTGLQDPAQLAFATLRKYEGGIPSPRDFYEMALDSDDGNGNAALAASIRQEMALFRTSLVVNSARSKADIDLPQDMVSACRRRMGLALESLGHTEYDEAVSVVLRRQRPLLVEHPESRAAKSIEKIARRLLMPSPSPDPVDLERSESYYELLDTTPTATFEEIRRSYQRTKRMYAHDSVAVTGLFSRARLETLHLELDRAYSQLMDAGKRKDYDKECFPDGPPVPRVVEAKVAPEQASPTQQKRPPMPDLNLHTDYTGSLLRQIREASGLNLREIADKSKIGMSYLEAIEGETFGKLPAVVYVRGFLVEYSKALGIESERVLATYLERYKTERTHLDEA